MFSFLNQVMVKAAAWKTAAGCLDKKTAPACLDKKTAPECLAKKTALAGSRFQDNKALVELAALSFWAKGVAIATAIPTGSLR